VKDGKKQSKCPVCKQKITYVSRDLFKKSECELGHKWHTCVLHLNVCSDWPKHSDYSKCTCNNPVAESETDKDTLKTEDVLLALQLLHPPDQWAFFDELRIGTGYGKDNEQRLDAWAVHYFPSKQNLTRCYEIKVSRSDFFTELNKPTKRRAGLRLSNEFYFVAPKGMIMVHEVPVECGLLEVAPNGAISTKIKAPYRNTIPPTFLFLASVCRRVDNQRKINYQELLSMLQQQQISLRDAQQIANEHLKYWSNFNQGNKEVPNQIANAIRDLLEDMKKESKNNILSILTKQI